MIHTKDFGVLLGNGEAVKGNGECRNVLLQLGYLDIIEDFLPFRLGNSDIILRVQWLEKLGSVTTNWKSQQMNLRWGRGRWCYKEIHLWLIQKSHLSLC